MISQRHFQIYELENLNLHPKKSDVGILDSSRRHMQCINYHKTTKANLKYVCLTGKESTKPQQMAVNLPPDSSATPTSKQVTSTTTDQSESPAKQSKQSRHTSMSQCQTLPTGLPTVTTSTFQAARNVKNNSHGIFSRSYYEYNYQTECESSKLYFTNPTCVLL